MKHLTIILTSAALALSVLNACASPKDGNEFKETALSGTPVRMDIPDTPINSVLSNNGHIVTLSKIEDREAGSVSSSVSVYSVKEEDIVLKGTLSLPGVTIYDKILLFPMDTEGYICGVSIMSANRFYGITETAELKELEALEQKTKGHVFNYSFTAPVCLLNGYFYFLEVGDDSNYSLNRIEDDGTIKPVCYLNKTGGEWLPYLGAASGNSSTIVFGYSFYGEILFLNTETGKAVSTSFEEPGFSEELARNLQGDILESQRKYYGGYIHVGKRVFLENLDGFIFASGEDTPDAILDVFSISGKPMKRLLLDRSGHCALDENGGRILLFTYGDNPELFVYKL